MMTRQTPRGIIASHLGSMIEPSDQAMRRADRILSALTAAGIGLYDTKTHVAAPREPTEAMIEVGWIDSDPGDIYRAMLAAAQETPAEKVSG